MRIRVNAYTYKTLKSPYTRNRNYKYYGYSMKYFKNIKF